MEDSMVYSRKAMIVALKLQREYQRLNKSQTTMNNANKSDVLKITREMVMNPITGTLTTKREALENELCELVLIDIQNQA